MELKLVHCNLCALSQLPAAVSKVGSQKSHKFSSPDFFHDFFSLPKKKAIFSVKTNIAWDWAGRAGLGQIELLFLSLEQLIGSVSCRCFYRVPCQAHCHVLDSGIQKWNMGTQMNVDAQTSPVFGWPTLPLSLGDFYQTSSDTTSKCCFQILSF